MKTEFSEGWRWWRASVEEPLQEMQTLHAFRTICRDGEVMIRNADREAACGFGGTWPVLESPEELPLSARCEECLAFVISELRCGKPIVIVESPYAGDVERNVEYARAAVADCLKRGEAPYASHLLYTQVGVLRDDIAEQRELGLYAGFAFRRFASKTVVYHDLGMSKGMARGIEQSRALGIPVEQRNLEEWLKPKPKPARKPLAVVDAFPNRKPR